MSFYQGGDRAQGPQRTGPLDMENWQAPQQANLIVRNVPSANVFVAANGMA
jgi:hypothetical protein